MPATFKNGQFEINDNGNLVFLDENDNPIFEYNTSSGNLELSKTFDAQSNDLSNIASASVDSLSATNATVSSSPSSANDVAIKDYVDTVAQGLEWKESVIDELNDPPASPNDGDRYLINDNPTGDWSGHPNEIAEYDGGTSSWTFIVPSEGWVVFIEDIDTIKYYDGTDWFAIGGAVDHGALSGLGDDDHTQYLLVDGTRAMSGSLDMGSNKVTNASSYEIGTDVIAQSVVASGQVTLSSGEATVDTGISATDATFNLALGVDDPDADVDLNGRLVWDDSAGTYKIDIVEATTSVGNPVANYDVVRVR